MRISIGIGLMIIVGFMFVNGIIESNQLDIISIDNPEKTPDFSLLTAKVLDQKESETMGLYFPFQFCCSYTP